MKTIFIFSFFSLISFLNYSQSTVAQFPEDDVIDGKITGGNLKLKKWLIPGGLISNETQVHLIEIVVGYNVIYTTSDIEAAYSAAAIYGSCPFSYLTSGGGAPVSIRFYRCPFGNCGTFDPIGVTSTYLTIYGLRKAQWSTTNFCTGNNYNLNLLNNGGLNNYNNLSGGTYSLNSTINGVSISSNSLNIDNTVNSGPVSIKYTYTYVGQLTYNGYAETSMTKQIYKSPNVVWINNDVQNGQTILTSDPCINLSGTAGCSNCTNFYYQSTGIANGTGSSFCPNISGAGSHTINAVGEITVGNTTCVNQEYQLLNVTYDPGTPALPIVSNVTSGYTLGYGTTLPPPSNSQCMHVCDGQLLSLRAGGNLPAGINIVEYSYLENGNLHIIGEFPKNTTITWQMPTRNSVRQDILRVRGKSTLGVFGSYNSIPVYVNMATKVVDQTILDTNCVTGALVYDPVQIIDNYGYSASSLFWTDIGSEYADDFEYSNTDFKVFDELGNLYTANTMAGYTHNLTDKYDTLFLVSSTLVPFESNYRNNMANPQSCVRKDTILVVQNPIVSFGFNGASVASVGELYQFISNNQYHDYTTWEFGDGSGIYTGDTMYHYMNDMGYYNITCTSWDNWGCNASNTLYSAIFVGDWTSVDENNVLNDVIAYPNPIIDYVDISLNSQINGSINFELISLSGQLIYSKEIDLQVGNQVLKITDIGDISSGTYFIVLKGTDFNYTSKIVKE